MATTNLSAKTVTAATGGNYAQANTGLDQLDLAATELRQVAVTANVDWSTGDDQTPASGKYKALRASIIEFTGAQAAGRTFTVPANKKWYYILNSCTGGFNTTFKTVTGTGIAIANGARKKVYNNGAEIIDWTTGGVGGSGVTVGTDAILAGATTHVITHNLGNAAAVLVGAYGSWPTGSVFKIAQDADTITVEFPNECPVGGGALDWSVTE